MIHDWILSYQTFHCSLTLNEVFENNVKLFWLRLVLLALAELMMGFFV